MENELPEMTKIYDADKPGGSRVIGVALPGQDDESINRLISIVLSAYPEQPITLMVFENVEDSEIGAWSVRVTIPMGEDDDVVIERTDAEMRRALRDQTR